MGDHPHVTNILNWKVKRKKKFVEGRDGALVISGCQELPPLFSAGVAGPRLCPTWGDVPLIISQEWPARKINRLQSKLLGPWAIVIIALKYPSPRPDCDSHYNGIRLTSSQVVLRHFLPRSSLIIPSDWPKRQLALPFSRFEARYFSAVTWKNGKNVKSKVMIKKGIDFSIIS